MLNCEDSTCITSVCCLSNFCHCYVHSFSSLVKVAQIEFHELVNFEQKYWAYMYFHSGRWVPGKLPRIPQDWAPVFRVGRPVKTRGRHAEMLLPRASCVQLGCVPRGVVIFVQCLSFSELFASPGQPLTLILTPPVLYTVHTVDPPLMCGEWINHH